MGRRYIYFCDNCGKGFNEDTHLNIKGGQIFVTYFDKLKKDWRQRAVRCLKSTNELHFCIDKACMENYFNEVIQKTLAEAKEVQNATKD